MDTLDIIRRMCLVPLPDETDPSEFYGTYKNPYCFWNMMAIWRRDDGAIMRSRFSMFNYGSDGYWTGPFSDGISHGENSSSFDGVTDVNEVFLYINSAGHRVYFRRERKFGLAGRGHKYFRVVRDSTDALISTESVGTAVAATGAVEGYSIVAGWNILGQIVEIRRNIVSINTAGDVVLAAANDADIVSIDNLGDIQTAVSTYNFVQIAFVKKSVINGVTTNYTQAGTNNRLSFVASVIDSDTYSRDKRIRLLGREMTSEEISASTVIFNPDGSLGSTP